MNPVSLEKTFRLASPPAELWPLVSNTDRLNRALGLPPTTSAGADPKDYSQQITACFLGLPLRWKEAPFDYVDSRAYEVIRDFHTGPFTRFQGGLRMRAAEGGTEATLYGSFTPRWAFTRPLVRAFAAKAMSEMKVLYGRIDDSIQKLGSFPAPPRTVTPVDEEQYAARVEALRGQRASKPAADRLIAHIKDSSDDELRGMRPFELADRWGLARTAALGACLHATKVGLLDLKWEVLCPNCAAPKESLGKLSELKSVGHCGSCEIDYGVDLGSSVELRFSVHPSVREAKGAVFCAGSPVHSRHAVAQLRLDGGAVRTVELDLASHSYTVRFLQMKRTVRLRPSVDGPATVSIDLAHAADGDELPFKPGVVKVVFQPALEPALVRIEKESWKDAAASASLVTMMQEFRDLFSSEVLAPGVEIGIKNLALLFTDLKGSTAMYEKVGDATAYGVVRDHFEWLTVLIAARGGAVVKTIGDAVMAVFPSGAGALEAALDMQERIAELDAKLAPRPPVQLKIGVHQGPSIAINAGGNLDYFGTMVNVSARVQNESAGGDIVVTKAISEDPACKAIIKRRQASGEHFTIPLKGLSGQFDLWRLTPRPSINK
ncbi:MAG: adenylate/guanylate cyclase domain-containing protein [Elusimicrobia bacterium]|nr:adenylate/guanylate cyclase domain-containing protein [Elusimicrobiota bacterium]